MPFPTNADLAAMQAIFDRLHGQVHIDKMALDDELATQAEKFRDVCDGVVLTISYTAAAKDEFDQIEARMIDFIRTDHERAHEGETKVPRLTDTAVMATVKQDQIWIDAKAIRRDWENMLNKMTGLKETYAQRSSNMKELPVLFAAGYWQRDSSTGQPRTVGQAQADVTRAERERRLAARENGGPAGTVPAGTSSERRRPRA